MIPATILATRTIAARFARQFILPIVIIGYIIIVALFILISILAHHYTALWWIFAIPLAGIAIVFTAIIVATFLIMRRLTPTTTKRQRRLAKQFVEEIGGYSELIGKSRIFIAYKIISDVIRKKPKSYINEITQKPGDLQRIFSELQDSFKH